MGHKCYISFKTEDLDYKLAIQDFANLDYVDKSLNVAIDSTDEDYVLQRIRSDYLSDSTVTIHLIGQYGAETRGRIEQQFIKGELRASLYNAVGNSKNGILGVVLPSMTSTVYGGQSTCLSCGNIHNIVNISTMTTISEFSYNYYIPNGKCAHSEEDRYCILVPWAYFESDPNTYIDLAFAKRTEPIASKTKVRP